MPPIPCGHCGGNFMRPTIDPEAPKLCNNCLIREEKRQIVKEDTMSRVDILIKCSQQDQIEIEEYCINEGIDFSRYFLELHYANQNNIKEMQRLLKQHNEPKEEIPVVETEKSSPKLKKKDMKK